MDTDPREQFGGGGTLNAMHSFADIEDELLAIAELEIPFEDEDDDEKTAKMGFRFDEYIDEPPMW